MDSENSFPDLRHLLREVLSQKPLYTSVVILTNSFGSVIFFELPDGTFSELHSLTSSQDLVGFLCPTMDLAGNMRLSSMPSAETARSTLSSQTSSPQWATNNSATGHKSPSNSFEIYWLVAVGLVTWFLILSLVVELYFPRLMN